MNLIKKPWVVNTLIVLGSVVVGLILAEIVLRLVLPSNNATPDRDVRMPSASLGYTFIPGVRVGGGFTIDSNGFNNSSVPAHADIVALGDSMTFGENGSVSQNWPQDLGRLMNLSVYNMGVGGYGPVQYYALTDKALSLHPAYVFVGLLLSNDFFDAYNMVYNGHLLDEPDYAYHGVPYVTDYWKSLRSPNFKNDIVQSGVQFNHEQNIPLEGLRVWIRAHSVLYNFLADRSYIIRERIGLAKPHVLGTTDWKQTDPDITLRYDNGSISTIFWEGETKIGVDPTSKNIIEGVRLTKELLLKMKAKVEASGAKFAVVVMPDKTVAYAPIIGDKINDNKDYVDNLKGETTLMNDTMSFCAQSGMTCINLLSGITQALKDGKTVYPASWDGHPVISGYQVFAQTIFDSLNKK